MILIYLICFQINTITQKIEISNLQNKKEHVALKHDTFSR